MKLLHLIFHIFKMSEPLCKVKLAQIFRTKHYWSVPTIVKIDWGILKMSAVECSHFDTISAYDRHIAGQTDVDHCIYHVSMVSRDNKFKSNNIHIHHIETNMKTLWWTSVIAANLLCWLHHRSTQADQRTDQKWLICVFKISVCWSVRLTMLLVPVELIW